MSVTQDRSRTASDLEALSAPNEISPVASRSCETAMSQEEFDQAVADTVNHIYRSGVLVAGAMCLSKDALVIERLNNVLAELERATLTCRLITS